MSKMAESIIGGIVSGALVKGLMKFPILTSNKQLISSVSVPASGSATLLNSTSFKFAIIFFHGDGDADITVTIAGATNRNIAGNQMGIEPIANETISITASNSNTTTAKNTPTIEILMLGW
jgi:hypothetical protein